jgi:hypothetical protein
MIADLVSSLRDCVVMRVAERGPTTFSGTGCFFVLQKAACPASFPLVNISGIPETRKSARAAGQSAQGIMGNIQTEPMHAVRVAWEIRRLCFFDETEPRLRLRFSRCLKFNLK